MQGSPMPQKSRIQGESLFASSWTLEENANIQQHKGRVDVARQATECKNDPKPAISRLRAGPTQLHPRKVEEAQPGPGAQPGPLKKDHSRVTGHKNHSRVQPLQGSTCWHNFLPQGISVFRKKIIAKTQIYEKSEKNTAPKNDNPFGPF